MPQSPLKTKVNVLVARLMRQNRSATLNSSNNNQRKMTQTAFSDLPVYKLLKALNINRSRISSTDNLVGR